MSTKKEAYHICFVTSAFYPAVVYGGPIFSNFNLCNSVQSPRYYIQVLTTNANKKERLDVSLSKNYTYAENFNVRYFDETVIGRYSFAFLKHARPYFEKCDLIHCSDMFSTILLSTHYLSKKAGVKVLISPRGSLSSWSLKKRFWIKALWLKILARILGERMEFLATSEKEKREILKQFPTSKIYIVPNGIKLFTNEEVKSFKEKKNDFLTKYKIENPKDVKIVSSLGRMHKKKGFDILIKTISQLDEKVSLIIAGPSGKESIKLYRLIQSLGLKNVHLLANLDKEEKNILLSISDVFALPTFDENFGNVFLEALNLGCPIVASKSTPWEEVRRYSSGIYTDNDELSFKKAIESILNDRKKFSYKNCKKHAEEFDIRICTEKIRHIYSSIIMQS